MRILVIGGGIGGLTAAIALGRRGHRHDREGSRLGGLWRRHHPAGQRDPRREAARHPRRLSSPRDSASTTSKSFLPDGRKVATVPSHDSWRATRRTSASAGPRCIRCWAGAPRRPAPRIRLGVTAETLEDDGSGVERAFLGRHDGALRPRHRRRWLHSRTRPDLSRLQRSRSSPARRCGATTSRSRTRSPACRPSKGRSAMGLVPLSDDADVHVRDDAGARQSALRRRDWPRRMREQAGAGAAGHRAAARADHRRRCRGLPAAGVAVP